MVRTAITFFVLAASSLSVQATIVSLDWQSSGDGKLTYDNVSGLEWLDLTETTNTSYNQMLAQINSPGDLYSSFRYATSAELDQLVQQFNLTTTNMLYSGFSNGIADLSGYLGITAFESPPGTAGYPGTGFYGFIGDLTLENYPWQDYRGTIGMYNSTTCQIGDCYAVEISYTLPDNAAEMYGHFLVRDATVVPIPAAAWLFGSGLICLAGIKRKK